MQVTNLVVLANESGSKAEFAVCVDDLEYLLKHIRWSHVYLSVRESSSEGEGRG